MGVGRFWRPKDAGGVFWCILRFAIGGRIWGPELVLESDELRLGGGGDVTELFLLMVGGGRDGR